MDTASHGTQPTGDQMLHTNAETALMPQRRIMMLCDSHQEDCLVSVDIPSHAPSLRCTGHGRQRGYQATDAPPDSQTCKCNHRIRQRLKFGPLAVWTSKELGRQAGQAETDE